MDLLLARILPAVSAFSCRCLPNQNLTLGVCVAKSSLTHVSQLDGSLAAGIHEPIAAEWVEFCSSNDLGQLLHVGRLDINNVEALILNVEVPQVDAQVITADVCFAIAVHRNAIDVVSVGVGVHAARYSGNDCVVVCHAREGEVGGAAEVLVGSSDGTATDSTTSTGRSEVLRQVVLGHDLEGFFKDLP